MKRTVAVLWMVVAMAGHAVAGGGGEDWLAAWKGSWKCGGLQGVAEGVAEGKLPSWSAVHSAGWGGGANREWESEGRELAGDLVRGLAESERRMREAPDGDFAAWANGLLTIRDSIAAEDAYVNLLLADAINRCVLTHLGVRMVRNGAVTEDHQAILEKLGRFHLSLESLETVVLEELGFDAPPDSLARASTEQRRLRAIWELPTARADGRMPVSGTGFDAESALRGQELEVLLARLVGSDAFIHTHLPSLVQCLQASKNSGKLPSREEIREIAGKETRAPASLGAWTLGVVRMASAASELLEECESGRIWQRLLLVKEPTEMACGEGGTAQPEETEAFRPNPVIQQCLKSFVAEDPEERMALFSEEERGACSTEEEWDGLLGRKIAWLAEQAGGSEALVGELLFLASRANDVPEGMLPYVFISRWDISPDVLADALRPYLATDDKRMAAEAAELLEAVETLKQNGIEAGSISVGTAQDSHAESAGTGGET